MPRPEHGIKRKNKEKMLNTKRASPKGVKTMTLTLSDTQAHSATTVYTVSEDAYCSTKDRCQSLAPIPQLDQMRKGRKVT